VTEIAVLLVLRFSDQLINSSCHFIQQNLRSAYHAFIQQVFHSFFLSLEMMAKTGKARETLFCRKHARWKMAILHAPTVNDSI